jgi:glycosyltransferase involved in cell wall biosynthesis
MINVNHVILYILEVFLAPFLFLIAILCKFKGKSIDVGLGPEPLVSHIYHKMALELYGYSAQTFVSDVYFITDKFDVRGDKIFTNKFPRIKNVLSHLYVFILSLLRYRCIYIYFNGGGLGIWTSLLWRTEPLLYKLANVKVVVMAYGGDVQEMSRSPNLLYKHAMGIDYPRFRFRRKQIARKIDLWTKYADHIIGGCDWVYYMYHWDTLTLVHFSIDVDDWKPMNKKDNQEYTERNRKLRILHAPNHRAIKGTQFFINAVDELVKEGLDIELIILERVPNEEVKKAMSSVDIVADQLIVGWYAMFALEAMAMGKPVLCNLREDLKYLYEVSGLVHAEEIPIVNCSPLTVKEIITDLYFNRNKIDEIGKRSREFVIKHHSTNAVGKIFDNINRSIGLIPSRKPS